MTNIPVFLASDDNYAPFVATTIASICDNTKSFIDFYVLDSGISPENKTLVKNIKAKFDNFSVEFIKIDIEKEFRGFKVNSYISMATYNRFLIPQLKPNLDKVLYLDVDIIAFGDIADLYNKDLNGLALGAVADQGNQEYISNLKNNVDMNIHSPYFNAGVLLMDIKKWREDDIISELFKIEEKYRGKLLCNDQDILNKYFENRYKPLNQKFNVMLKGDDIVIRHYAFDMKPWSIQNPQHYSHVNNVVEFMNYVHLLNIDIESYKIPIPTLRMRDIIKKKYQKGKSNEKIG